MLSLHARQTIAASIVLAAFLGGTGLALEQAFREAALEAEAGRLQAQVYALLGAMEVDDSGRPVISERLAEGRFASPDSGLYAWIDNAAGKQLWRSPSLLGRTIKAQGGATVGQILFREIAGPEPARAYLLSTFGINWESEDGRLFPFTIYVAEDQTGLRRQLSSFRRSLWGWLGLAALMLLLVQGLILRWSLQPLRRAAAGIAAIEAGEKNELGQDYPSEIRPLSDNLDRLLRTSSAQVQRYREALGDLAHSLKTPLAVLRAELGNDGSGTASRQLIEAQLQRMDQAVSYHLQRAAAAGRHSMVPVPLAPLVQRVSDALARIHADKGLSFKADIPEGTVFHGDAGDLTEILGNLLDNAFKWGRGQVTLRASVIGTEGLRLEIEDDGPGIPPEQAEAVLQRGIRADSQVEGQGIGLALVRELVEQVYGGRLAIHPGSRQGCVVRIELD